MRIKELIEKLNRPNDGTRTLFESIVVPEVLAAFNDWKKNVPIDNVLIGGLALSFYVKPRTTMDVDLLFLSREQIPASAPEFKRTRPSAFQHNQTHVEIEVLSPETINKRPELVKKVFDTANVSDNIKIASPSGLVALKLGRFSYQDMADIEALINAGQVNLDDWPLTDLERERYEKIKREIIK